MWALAYSHNGYFRKFQVYAGKEGSGEKHLGQRVVKDLTHRLKGKHYHVFFDNFFTSEELLRHLAEDNIYAKAEFYRNNLKLPVYSYHP